MRQTFTCKRCNANWREDDKTCRRCGHAFRVEVIPVDLPQGIADAIENGFYSCRKCGCCKTEKEGEFIRCSRCKSYQLKFNPGIK